MQQEGRFRRHRWAIAFLVVALSLAAVPGVAASWTDDMQVVRDAEAAARFIVGFRNHPSDIRIGGAYLGATVLDLAAVGAWAWVETSDPMGFEAAAREDLSVWSVARDSPQAVRAAYTPNDPQWSNQ